MVRRVQALIHSDGGHTKHVANRDLNCDLINKKNPSYQIGSMYCKSIKATVNNILSSFGIYC